MRALIGETLCSGIGAPEVAAPWIDWRRAFDIDDFARAVFVARHGYAEDPAARRYVGGDFTAIGPDDYRRHGWPWPDIIVAGTPCQAFSVAGLRRGRRHGRGNVTLEFVKHVHAITDAARLDGAAGPVVLWENVPGVFSQSDNAFGAFLGGLVGADDALPRPFGQSWPDAGMASGPRGRLAWRVFDAQHVGLAQRRRRVFLVFDPGDRADPVTVLFERQGVRGHPAAGREAREDVAAPVTAGSPRGSGYRNDADTTDNLIPVAFGGNNTSGPIDVATAVNAAPTRRYDVKSETFVAIGFNARQDPDSWAARTGPLDTDGCTQAVAFAENSRAEVRLEGGAGARTGALSCGGGKAGQGVPMIADGWAVRRLTPREAERLQGFPDDFTLIPWGKGEAADSRRYKALGNSMAVPVVRWILTRLTAEMEARDAA